LGKHDALGQKGVLDIFNVTLSLRSEFFQ